MPLPTVDDLLSDLGGAHVFSAMGSVSGLFPCSIHEESIPTIAVCTQAGDYEWTVMPMGLASSLVCCVFCHGLKRIRLFIDDMVCVFEERDRACVRP